MYREKDQIVASTHFQTGETKLILIKFVYFI